MTLHTPLPASKTPRFSRKSIVSAIATLLLHVVLLQSISSQESASVGQRSEKTVEVSLLPAPQEPHPLPAVAPLTELKKELKKEQKTAEKVPSKQQPATPPAAAATLVAKNSSTILPPTETTANATITLPASESIASASTPPVPATPEPDRPEDPPAADEQVLVVEVPASAQLSMQLIRTEPDRKPTYGVGMINWEVNDGRYHISIEAGLDLLITSINLYKLSSEGTYNQYGITPSHSSEARLNRAKTASHFQYENKTISFSASSNVVAMSEGAQDKASFLMQLAGIGKADASQFSPGREIAIQVAEEKEAGVFLFVVAGQEDISTKLGALTTWHLVRAPRPGTYNSRLDIWLAPSLGWYPVQIRNTESNGTITTQTVTKITQKSPTER
ncbi:DUF3108 domain-containing protein [soil metagenome]